jgi:hypothetical protein
MPEIFAEGLQVDDSSNGPMRADGPGRLLTTDARLARGHHGVSVTLVG